MTDPRGGIANPYIDEAQTDWIDSAIQNTWVGPPVRGGLPKVPSRDVLPTASADLAYRQLVLRGTPDIEYICLRDAGGVWGWKVRSTG
jgi:hypothetical protein